MKQGDLQSLTKGLEFKKLSEVCILSAGGDVPKDNFSETKTEKYNIPIYANGEKNEGLYGYTNIAKVIQPSITVSARGTIGFSVKRLEAFFPVVRLIVVTPKNQKELELDFLDYCIKRIDFKHSGSSIPQLTVPMIRDYEIPLPPLPEQQRIVAILDRCCSVIDRAKAISEQNLKNTKELFESYLNRVFEKKGEDWEEKTLGEVCVFENGDRGKNYPNKSHRVITGIPFVNAGHLNDNKLDFNEMDYISEQRFNMLGNGKIKPNDILFCLRGSLGKVAKVGNLEKGAIASSLVIIRAKNELDNDFLLYFLNSKSTTKQVVDFGNGAAQPNLSAGSLKQFIIPYPNAIEHQQTIVLQLDALQSETKRLEKHYTKKIADLEELKKSILQKAFNGELNTVVDLENTQILSQ
jgi:type I restriction enzyme S subunit